MTREEVIQEIDDLYPTDSEFPETNKIGLELLEQAKRNCSNWRDLPDNILFEYRRLCRERLRESER